MGTGSAPWFWLSLRCAGSSSGSAHAKTSLLELPGLSRGPRTPVEAPRFRGWYRYRCGEHRQGVIDWEWVAFQRRLLGAGDQVLRDALRGNFLDEICADRDERRLLRRYQAKRQHVLMVLGVFYPLRYGAR